nr:MAG TPA: hypothetical protein [Caudoviricetes sp.]
MRSFSSTGHFRPSIAYLFTSSLMRLFHSLRRAASWVYYFKTYALRLTERFFIRSLLMSP